jgi:hypothetical protein
VKNALKGKRFQDVEGMMENATAELKAVPLEAFADFKHFLNDSTIVFKVRGDYSEEK